MQRFLKLWSLRSLLLIALVLVVPLGHASAQSAPSGVTVQASAPVAQEEPEADLGPSNEAAGPEDEAMAEPEEDVSPSDATGPGTLDPNAPSPSITEMPEGGEGGG